MYIRNLYSLIEFAAFLIFVAGLFFYLRKKIGEKIYSYSGGPAFSPEFSGLPSPAPWFL